ncbi:MAG: DNA-binding protein [Oligoflexia bacterium]|nr:DNA-binding protein [Oligoflexia bacterium]
MGILGVNEEQVFETADKLLAAGTPPTLQAVRNEIGSGSYSTISRHLTRWKASQRNKKEIPQPPAIFTNYMNKVWSASYTEAERVLDNDRQALQVERSKMQEEITGILSIVEKVENERDLAITQITDLKKNISELNSKISQLDQQERKINEELTTTKAQLVATESRRLESTERADRLEQQLANLLKDQLISAKKLTNNSEFSSDQIFKS